MNKKLTVVSICDGIACAMQTLKSKGYKTDDILYFASEIDKDTIKVAMDNHPSIIQIGDVRNLHYEDGRLFSYDYDWSVIDKEIKTLKSKNEQDTLLLKAKMQMQRSKRILHYKGQIDLLCAGTPCTDVSVIGKGLGLFGATASALFWQFERLLKNIKPANWLLENVNMADKWKNHIDKALGTSPLKLNSADYGPQNRVRLYWSNLLTNAPEPPKNVLNLEDIIDISLAHKQKKVTAQKDEPIYPITACAQRARYVDGDKSKTVQLTEFRKDKKANCLTTVAKNSFFAMDNKVYDFNVNERERLQGLPDNYCSTVSNSKAVKLIGNAWSIYVIKYFFEQIKLKQNEYHLQ